ncbi:MAG: restriction endonuclease subunit S [Thomasclavelia sp.]
MDNVIKYVEDEKKTMQTVLDYISQDNKIKQKQYETCLNCDAFNPIKIDADGLTTEYLKYFIESKYLLLNTKKKGTGTPHLNANILKESKLVVPTIDEQKQIVARIEELFSNLDNAVETLYETKAKLNKYKQAVLKDAFDGKLTKSWRDKQKIPYSFKKVSISSLVKSEKNSLKAGPFGSSLKRRNVTFQMAIKYMGRNK